MQHCGVMQYVIHAIQSPGPFGSQNNVLPKHPCNPNLHPSPGPFGTHLAPRLHHLAPTPPPGLGGKVGRMEVVDGVEGEGVASVWGGGKGWGGDRGDCQF